MTKVDAIEHVMIENGGSASLQYIYDNIEKFYPSAKVSKNWSAGIRGVLYRELTYGSRFKKIGLSIYALSNYQEEKIKKTNKVRRHSLMEGMCIELGNSQNFNTFTADPSALYRDNTFLNNIATISDLPLFTYKDIIHQAKLIDVLWFNKSIHSFPQYAFEIVDSISTLNGAINRCMQLHNFRTKFFIVAPEEHHTKFEQTMDLAIYRQQKELFTFLSYHTIQDTYERLVEDNESLKWLH